MQHRELVALIRPGVPSDAAADVTWADFGAGSGAFTRALADLLPPEAVLYAVDRDVRALERLRTTWPTSQPPHTIAADINQPPTLPPFDGLLMANALHFNRAQKELLHTIHGLLKPGGRLLLVEYDVRWPRAWIPYPISYKRFERLAADVGFSEIEHSAERRSPSTGIVMYAACARRDKQ
jgi:SAM-dependent methyltransferase